VTNNKKKTKSLSPLNALADQCQALWAAGLNDENICAYLHVVNTVRASAIAFAGSRQSLRATDCFQREIFLRLVAFHRATLPTDDSEYAMLAAACFNIAKTYYQLKETVLAAIFSRLAILLQQNLVNGGEEESKHLITYKQCNKEYEHVLEEHKRERAQNAEKAFVLILETTRLLIRKTEEINPYIELLAYYEVARMYALMSKKNEEQHKRNNQRALDLFKGVVLKIDRLSSVKAKHFFIMAKAFKGRAKIYVSQQKWRAAFWNYKVVQRICQMMLQENEQLNQMITKMANDYFSEITFDEGAGLDDLLREVIIKHCKEKEAENGESTNKRRHSI
jgi:hypothetical protein